MSSQAADEETPLLPLKRTPIPWFQISILGFIQLAEPLTSHVIYPFAPELIRDIGITHGNETQVGYYVGLLQSLFYVAEAATILHWSRTSDHIGRKPVILLGLFGLSLSMFCFGLSKTFWGLVLSRCLNGALNGNIGVMKSAIAELSDPTNIAQIYALLPIAWAAGGTVAPIIGGSLSRPVERFPILFGGNEFFKEYPYFLPCAMVATFSVIAWLVAFLFLDETHKNPTPTSDYLGVTSRKTRLMEHQPSAHANSLSNKPVPIRSLFTPRVMVAAASYAAASLLDITFRVIQPLFFSTPIALGGLGLPPSVIGYILATYGIINGVFQVFFFAKIHDAWRSKKSYMAGIACVLPAFACFPVISWLGKRQGLSMAVWMLIAVQNATFVGLGLSFGASFIYIAAASPNHASLGATNGLSQMIVSMIRALGPAAASSLFSLSIERGYLGGHLVYYFLILTVFGALWVGSLLPNTLWTR